MSRPIIEVEKLSKRYRLGQFNAQTMREEVEQLFSRFRERGNGSGGNISGRDPDFWALKNVSFSVQPGEVVGIIGRNGAGKSTLLKILSRVTEPTSGVAYIRGRVASLLEVGTGFHPELTGRENVYLNGAMLGMTRAEIKRKFDEIVDFSGVEKFIDTPVKRFSSGMYVRLAFAVAAYLEPEILVVDEVLAVGDADFQKKCLGKMGEVSTREGRTVLFVSHNMDALRRCCQTGLLLSEGRVVAKATIGECIETYLHRLKPATSGPRLYFPPGEPNRHHIIDVEILDEQLTPISSPATWQSVVFAIRYYSPAPTPRASVTFQISTTDGNLLSLFSTRPDQNFDMNFEIGENTIYLRIDSLALSAGSYVIGAGLALPNTAWLYNEPHGAIMEVVSRDVYGAGTSPIRTRYLVPMSCCWEIPPKRKQTVRQVTASLQNCERDNDPTPC